jgi:alpha-L-rhamnosidase
MRKYLFQAGKALFVAGWLLMGMIAFAAPSGQELSSWPLRVVRTRCEYQDNPLGIDHPAPRLSWTLESSVRGQRQTAYRILVADSSEALQADQGTLWDSGKVNSNQNINHEYAGRQLVSGQCAYWKVGVWDKEGHFTDWSAPSRWEMGLLKDDDWTGHWIYDGRPLPQEEAGFYRDDPAPLFRKDFLLTGLVRHARLYISGLGYYQASLNGTTVGDHHLGPIWTRPDKRVFYSTYDVTQHLVEGRNCLGVTLGNGWYNPLPLRMWGRRNLREHLPVGRPRFIAQLNIEYADGSRTSVVSDTSWKWAPGPILRNSIYLGEKYDARREVPGWNQAGFNDTTWTSVQEAPEPGGALHAQPVPPIRITKRLKPVRITEPESGVYIVDMGQNFSGWARFCFDEAEGTEIVIRYGELLHSDGTLNPMTSVCGQIKGKPTPPDHPGPPGVAWQTDTYIAKGAGPETYTPRFTFHAFRYIEITGLSKPPTIDSIEGLRLNSDVEPVGSFECSNDLFNRIQKMCQWTFLSNLFGVQSDCPHRERFAYGGDIVTSNDAFMLNYDMAGFYAKTARDWHDSALEDGMLTDTAPDVGIQYCGVGWAMVHPLLQTQLYRYYGDRRIVEEQYATSKRWLDLVRKSTTDLILRRGLHDHECLQREETPPMVTPLYRESARMLSQLARILGRNEEADDFQRLAEQIKAAYVARFLSPGTGVVASGIQSVQAFALVLDMLPEAERPAALEHLIRDIHEKNDGRLTTGIFGTKYMLEGLSREGQVETAYSVVNHREFPGWGHMLEQGATTLWEHWKFSDNTFSHNHPMFGSVSQWFYNWLGGIEPAPDAVGFDRILLHPRFVDGLEWVSCRINTIRGPVVCNWKRIGKRVALTIEVPVNATAELSLAVASPNALTENGHPAAVSEGIEKIFERKDLVAFRLASGTYRFEVHP